MVIEFQGHFQTIITGYLGQFHVKLGSKSLNPKIESGLLYKTNLSKENNQVGTKQNVFGNIVHSKPLTH